ncbi:MAG: pentapeptide repeat-containing protein [Spirulinaceae cyanobacterium]
MQADLSDPKLQHTNLSEANLQEAKPKST